MIFFVLDVETANADLSSICQMGIVAFQDKKIIETWKSLIDPEDEFSQINISIHGITKEKVAGAPIFPYIYESLYSSLKDKLL